MKDRLSFAAATLCPPLVAMIAIVAVTSNSPAQQSTSDTQLKAQPKRLPAEKWRQPPQGAEPELLYSPWAKFCLTGQEPNARQVCFTGKDGRHEGGPVVAVVLIEPENEPKKVLRITLPLGMSLQPGTRVIVDNDQPMTGPYVACFNNGCMADYEASGELIGKLKKGKRVVIQGINNAGQPLSLVVPLSGFAEANDGPASDPRPFQAQQEKPRIWRDDTLQPHLRPGFN